ncbi:membrane protein [Bacteroidia bacterium]|nr:membrane protein [Bacteroidia bacterium]
MVIGSAIQAIYGSLQLWGFYPSHHSLFKMSGSFFNPGPFAGYLASIFPVTLGLYIFKINPFPIIDKKLDLANWIAGITLIAILMVLPASQSRAAWMAVIVSSLMILMIRYPVGLWLKKYSWLKRGIVLLLVCGIIGASLFGLLRFKTDSANGRLLIWKVTLSMVANHPLTGVGFDRFKTFYMNEQAGYFEQTPDSPEAMVAGDTNYCFNEFLQHTAENGLIGLLLLLAILAYAFRVTNKRFNNLLWIAKAGIGGIAVFALFSYPAQILPIKANLIAYLACISTLAEGKKEWIFIKKQAPIKYTLAVFSVGIIIICTVNLSIYRVACNNWKQAYQLHTRGYYAESLNYYEKGWSVLKTNGDYLTQYGKALNLAGKHEQAIKILQQAVKYFPNIVVYTALGDSYKAQEKSGKAEQAYLRAWYMNPSRFYPKYLLAKLYDETGQAEKAIAIATELLNKEVKIESTAIDEIKAEMKKILQKYLGSPVGFKLQKWRSP